MPSTSDVPVDVDFSNLYPAIIECFVIIFCGYLAGRGNFISHTESKGLNVFVGTFCLPSLIFVSMAKLDFSSVNWIFLAAILISKAFVFFLVLFVTLLINRSADLGRAGIYAIFCTQSNDFALGYPIVAALYENVHPEYASYLYLIAPISFLILNPIGYVLMEITRFNSSSGNSPVEGSDTRRPTLRNNCVSFFLFSWEIMKNPFIFMTIFGIAANFIFSQKLPDIIESVLKVFGNAFSACALFLLGLTMVGKIQHLKGSSLVTPGVLIAVKTLVLPLVTRETVSLLNPGGTPNATDDFSNYGFLYGTFPAAPGVFVVASNYGVAVDLIANAMVACTFLSAPLMFISAKMITLVNVNPLDYLADLHHFLFNMAIVGLLCCIWVCFVFCLTKKWRKVPHFFTLCLAVSQGIACIGALMWASEDSTHSWKVYLQFSLLTFGVFSARVWTALLSISLFVIRWKSMAFLLRIRTYMALLGWSIPGILVFVLVMLVQEDSGGKSDPNFQYGSKQAIVALFLLWLCLFTTMACLVLQQRFERQYASYEPLPVDGSFSRNEEAGGGRYTPGSIPSSPEVPSLEGSPTTSRSFLIRGERAEGNELHREFNNTSESNVRTRTRSQNGGESLFSYIEQSSPTSSHGRTSPTTAGPHTQLTEPEELLILRDRDDELQILRHVVLLLLLCGSMIVGLSLCLWSLVTPVVNGVFVELVFLDVFLNFGQAAFTVVIFCLDVKWMFLPLTKWWRYLLHGSPKIRLPALDKLDIETRQICEQFSTYHLDKCIKDIVRDRSWRMRDLPSSFAGFELVDWLIMVGLAHDRADAIKYGRRLLNGRIIHHVEELHHFHDQPIFYKFVKNDRRSSDGDVE